MELLLTDMLNDSSKVPLRISLAAITKLRSYKNVVKKMINSKEKVQLIVQIARNAALEDIGQFFEAFVAITSIFSYHYGQTCILLAESVPPPKLKINRNLQKCYWIKALNLLTVLHLKSI